jgi:hypothetical protein
LGFGPRIEHLLDTRRDIFIPPKWT